MESFSIFKYQKWEKRFIGLWYHFNEKQYMKYKTLVNRIVTAVEAEHGEGGTKHQYI